MRPSPIGELERDHGPWRYVYVWLALSLFTALTFCLSRLSLGPWRLPVAIAIACAKSTLVILFFMHLWEHRGANQLALCVAVIFIAVLILLVLGDVAFRFPIANPPQSITARQYRGPFEPPKSGEPDLGPDHQPISR